MADNAVNLDHLLLSIEGPGGVEVRAVLNEFISDDGRASRIRLASDPSLLKLRDWLLQNGQIKFEHLSSPVEGLVEIHTPSSFAIALTQIQSGRVQIPRDSTTGLPTLQLNAVGSTGLVDPQPQPEQQPVRPRTTVPGDTGRLTTSSGSSRGSSRQSGDTKKPPAGPSRRGSSIAGPSTPRSAPSGGGPPRTKTSTVAPPTRPGSSRSSAPKRSADPSSVISEDSSEPKDTERGTRDKGKQPEIRIDLTGGRETTPEEEERDAETNAGEDSSVLPANEDIIWDKLGLMDEGGIDDDTWEEVCRFFNCSTTVERINVPGINPSIEGYQMHAIWLMLTQVTRQKASLMLGDAMGFGKTGMSLTVAVLFRVLHRLYDDVVKEWEGEIPQRQRKHLPSEGQLIDAVCPSQGSLTLQCPCVRPGLAYQIIDALPSAPTVIICPPDLIKNWMSEFNKWVDKSRESLARDVEMTVSHSNYVRSTVYHTPAHVTKTKTTGAPVYFVLDDKPNYLLRPSAKSGAQNIIIVSRSGTTNFLAPYKGEKSWYGDHEDFRGQKIMTFQFVAGLVFFDEFHNYKGNKKSVTEPFQMLAQISGHSLNPTIAIGLSGSLRSSPTNWRPFVRHHLDVAYLQGWTEGLAGLENIDDLEEHINDFEYLVNNLHISSEDKKEEIEKRQDRLTRFLKAFIPEIILARTQSTPFRGKPVFKSAKHREETYSMRADSPAAIMFRELAQSVHSWIDKQFEEEIQRWTTSGGVEAEPDSREFQQQTLYDLVHLPQKSTAFEITMHASCYPPVAYLVAKSHVDYGAMFVESISTVATKVSDLLYFNENSNPDREQVLNALRESPWWDHMRELIEDSPKYGAIRAFVHDLLGMRDIDASHPDNIRALGPAPPDGTNIRHGLIYSDSPLSAFITFMLLYTEIEDPNVQFIYLHAGIGADSRGELFQYMQQDCRPRDPTKILISTFRLGGEGHNLQRANYCLLTEVPRSADIQQQAFGRIDRTGQKMRPFLTQLYDDRNLAEKVRRVRNRNRSQLALVGHDEHIDLTEFE
ncbi:hypothetical protein F4779DRAFT_637411 [Xylariaceae sp. FL0662B]|nr:hypothetical protein F4779DRAFT_637411 [Xylariaceae sp. FL0662B]